MRLLALAALLALSSEALAATDGATPAYSLQPFAAWVNPGSGWTPMLAGSGVTLPFAPPGIALYCNPSGDGENWSPCASTGAAGSRIDISNVISDATYKNTVVGLGSGTPSTKMVGGDPRGARNTFYGTNIMPNPGFVQETTAFGTDILQNYTGYCGDDPVAQVETGLNLAFGDQILSVIGGNPWRDCTRPSTNVDVVAIGQKVLSIIPIAVRSVFVGNHGMNGSDQYADSCTSVGAFTLGGQHVKCSSLVALGNDVLNANDTLNASTSIAIGSGAGYTVQTLSDSTLLGTGAANATPKTASITQSDIFGTQSALRVGMAQGAVTHGWQAAQQASTIIESQAIGRSAAAYASTLNGSTVIGTNAGGSGTISGSIFIGAGTGQAGTETSWQSALVGVGVNALRNYYQPVKPDDYGQNCGMTAVGYLAATSVASTASKTPCHDVFLGDYSGTNATNSDGSTFVGSKSGLNGSAVGNEDNLIALGYNARFAPGTSNAIQIGAGTNSTSGTVRIGSETLINANGTHHAALYTPASSSAACVAGDYADDANYHYVCVATNNWRRVALSAF